MLSRNFYRFLTLKYQTKLRGEKMDISNINISNNQAYLTFKHQIKSNVIKHGNISVDTLTLCFSGKNINKTTFCVIY